MRLHRKIDGLLSEGRGMQLIWLAIILIASFFVFWGISEFVFRDGVFKWQDIIAMYLDPGVFAGAGRHDFFRLFITIFGVFFFAAMLISVVSNIFENISESYKKGETRYRFDNQVLILGANHLLFGMLSKLREKCQNDVSYKSIPIIIMTTQPIEFLRDRIEAYFGDPTFMRHITLYFDERDLLSNLKAACADRASSIFIIGEDGEDNHDAVNLKCLKELQELCDNSKYLLKHQSHVISCCVVMESQTTMSVFHYKERGDKNDSHNDFSNKLHIDIVNANEYEAEQVIASESFPSIDRSLDKHGNVIPGIRPESDQSVHLVIYGLTQMGRAFATTAANQMHYPNFKNGLHRSKITFIGENIKKPMDDFCSRYSNLFKMSHSTYVRFDEDDNVVLCKKDPDEEYDDYLDIEWQFIDSHPSSPNVSNLIKDWAKDKSQALNIAVCYGTSSENTTIALHLPKEVYDQYLNIPIFIHIRDNNEIIEKACKTKQFGNLFPFGAASTQVSDPLFERRASLGKRVNFIYDRLYGDKIHDTAEQAWYSNDCAEWSKLSSIYSGISAYAKSRSFPSSLKGELDDKEIESLCEVEHRRWTMAEFLLGYSAPTKAEKEYLIELHKINEAAFKKQKIEQKVDKYHHWDMIPFDDLSEHDKDKDYVIVKNIRYILGRGELDLTEHSK
jgi:hypothetical protein